MYDGFISYSHAADGLLAPRLQAGLQRFAKPWWKRRAVRIFRDESSLSANPHLWSSITEALDSSGWFVLLLSPDAANSDWVNQEIAYWKTNRDPSRILPVVTDGEFGWADGDVTGDAVPEQLEGVFVEEPRWLDLRWARDEEHLDLKNPHFSAAVADIASALRGVPKDELESEEVRQHRRTVRTAWSAGGLVLALAVVAVWAGILSARNATEAERQAEIAFQNEQQAEANATEAEANAAEAERQAGIAEANAREAASNADLATAREWAAAAVGVLDTDPVLSKLLALEAIATTPGGTEQPVEVVNSLWQAVATDRLTAVIDTGFDGYAKIHVPSDGNRIVVTSSTEDVVRLYDAGSLETLWEWRLEVDGQPSDDTVWYATVGSSGLVAVGVLDAAATYAVRNADSVADARPNRIVILDASDGTEITALEFPGCTSVNMGIWSPDGERLAVSSGFSVPDVEPPCERVEAQSGSWIEIFDTTTWEWEAILDVPLQELRFGPVPEFDDAGRIHVFGARTIETYGTDYELVGSIEGSFGVAGDVTRDGSLVVSSNPASLRTSLYETETGRRLTFLTPYRFPQISHGVRFSSDDGFVIYGNDTAETLVWDVASAEVAYRLPSGTAEWTHLDEATMRAYTGHDGGLVKIWDLTPPSIGRTPVGDLGAASRVDANAFAFGPDLGAFVADDLAGGTALVRFFDLSSGALVDSPGLPEMPNHNPERLTELDRIVPMLDGRFIYNNAGRWIAHDPMTGEEQFIVGCESEDSERCDSGDPLHVLAASVDGTSIVARPRGGDDWLFFDGRTGAPAGGATVKAPPGLLTFTEDWYFGVNEAQIYALDRNTGDLLLDYPAVNTLHGDVSASGQIAAVSDANEMVVIETDGWTSRRTEFGFGYIRAVSISPDDSMLAVGDEGAIHILDLQNLELLQSVGVGNSSDIHWLSPDRLLVGTSDGSWATVSLDVQDLVDAVQDSLLRGFTEQECRTYRIDPCPSLEEIRSR